MQSFVKSRGMVVIFFAFFSMGAFAEPDLSLSTNSISFSVYEGGSNPGDELLAISNGGDESLSWEIYDVNEMPLSLPEWLNVTPASGSVSAGNSGYAIVQANIAGLSGGSYDYAFEVVSPAAQNSPQRVDVSFEVIGSILEISSQTFVFPFDEANFNTEQILTFHNPGGGLLNWSITDPNETSLTLPGWLTFDLVSGSLAHDEFDDVTLMVDITDLPRGQYVYVFEVNAEGAQNSPQAITVTVDIGGVIYVPGNFPTIQSAIDAAEPNDMIVVLPGTYVENIDFNGKDVILMAMKLYDPSVTEETVIDGDSKGSVVTFSGSETSACVLRGFVVTNGYQLAAGGGILGNGSAATIDQCVIIGNIASWGAGLCACNGAITNCLIASNAAYYDGGGLALCDGVIKNCTISGNFAVDDGGGLFDCIGSMTNCIVWSNEASETEGIYGSLTPIYSCLQNWTGGGTGNRVANPLFNNEANFDYHLKSAYGRWDPNDGQWKYDGVTSPCIDGGSPERISFWNSNDTPADPNDDYLDEYTDPNAMWTRELWPHGELINMGVYGGMPEASMSPNPAGNVANLNHDDQVGTGDLTLFIESWLLQRDLLDTDLDRDGDVDYADFVLFSNEWLLPVELLPPPAPTGLVLITDELDVELDWDDSSYEYFGSYNVYRATDDANDLELLVSDLADSQYADPNLSDGTDYFYVVTVASVFGSESAYSALVSVEFPSPPAPTELSALVYDDKVELDWADSEYDYWATYNVYRSTDPEDPVLLVSGVTDSQYTDDSVVGGMQYYYSVTAVSLYDSESEQSVQVFAHPPYELYDHFEGGFGNWNNVELDDTDDWIRNSGSTDSSGTGPSSGANGSLWYIYLEAGFAGTAGDSAILESPEINGIDRTLSFYYHMYGAGMGTLNVDVYSDGTWTDGVWSLSGEQQTSSGEAYRLATVDLSAYTGLITIRLRAVAAGGYAGDMAIDEITISGIQ